MPFTMKSSSTPVPTHLRWVAKGPEGLGETHDITMILLNPEWRTITFFTDVFKLNNKYGDDKEYLEAREQLYLNLKRGTCLAVVEDKSTSEPLSAIAEVTIEPTPVKKGGRKYKFSTNRIDIDPRESLDSEE